jgi:phage terminase large subunit-like protein
MEEGLLHPQRMLCAANQIGKTRGTSLPELIYHLTGIYPSWWKGYKFKKAINAWALGVTGEQIRDVLQTALFGKLNTGDRNFDGTGLLPLPLIKSITRDTGTSNLAKDVIIQSVYGESKLSFKAYSQGQAKLMGSVVDFVLVDEYPEDPEIYPQLVTRTINGGNGGTGGRVAMYFTPEFGYTNLIRQFREDKRQGQYFQNATWDDAPHLTEERKKQILDAYPPYQRDMRSKGIPVMGKGMVYPVSQELIEYDASTIQFPDHWPRIAGLDFGMDHPEAVVWMCHDIDSDTVYVYDCFRGSIDTMGNSLGPTPMVMAPIINSRGQWIPVAWPHDGYKHDKMGSGLKLAEQYSDLGVNMLHTNSAYEAVDKTKYKSVNSVEAGIFEILDRMQAGQFKVASHLKDWFEEQRMYHRTYDEKTHKTGISKIHDDLMDATRYGIMMLRYAKCKPVRRRRRRGRAPIQNSTGY